MEFHEKLQELRRQRGLTQEELAERLYVSRTAVSKWESSRGYPNIESLKAIAKCFSVTVDELLSGEELITVAEADQMQKVRHFRDLVFGLLDLCAVILLYLPVFAGRGADIVQSAPLFAVPFMQVYVKAVFLTSILAIAACGALMLMLLRCQHSAWTALKYQLSIGLSVLAVLIFTVSLQPYPAVLILALTGVKLLILFAKRQ